MIMTLKTPEFLEIISGGREGWEMAIFFSKYIVFLHPTSSEM